MLHSSIILIIFSFHLFQLINCFYNPQQHRQNDFLNNDYPTLSSRLAYKKYRKPLNDNEKNTIYSKLSSSYSNTNMDNNHQIIPHQYMIQIRWGKPNQQRPLLMMRKGDDRSFYRKYSHQEEEHWHDKKWINIGPAAAVSNSKNNYRDHDSANERYYVLKHKFHTLPVYARRLNDRKSIEQIRRHFHVPMKSFPINDNFIRWTDSDIKFRKSLY